MQFLKSLRTTISENPLAAVILVLFIILVPVYSYFNPVFEPPDEHLHYNFVRYLQTERRLPVVDVTAPGSEFHQPPLYYALTAVLTAPLPLPDSIDELTIQNPFWGYRLGDVGRDNKNQFLHDPEITFFNNAELFSIYLMRSVATIISIGTLIFAYAIAREFLSKQLAATVMAIVAFTPNFILTAGMVNNDSLVTLAATATGYVLLRLVSSEEPPPLKHWIGLSILLGLGSLTKASALPLLPVSAVVVTLLAIRFKSFRLFVTAGTILLGGVLLIAGWWFIRNLSLYGELTGFGSMWAVWGVRPPLTIDTFIEWLTPFRRGYWVNFGYGNIPVPNWVYIVIDLVMLGGVGGLVLAFFRQLEIGPLESMRRDQLIMIMIWVVITFAGLIWYLWRTPAVTGRQLYAILPIISLAIVSGWVMLLKDQQSETYIVAELSLIMVSLAVGSLLLVLIPAYSQSPRLAQAEVAAIPHRLDWQIGETATLLGYDIQPTQVEPGEAINLTLYWQVNEETDNNYSVFVDLLDANNTPVGERDTYPGLGNDPTIFWKSGEIISDTIPVHIEEGAGGPVLLHVVAGLYDVENDETLVTVDPAGNLIEHPLIGTVKLRSSEEAEIPGQEYPVNATYEKGITLLGYDLDEAVGADTTLELTLYWRAFEKVDVDYTIFVHLIDGAGTIIAQGDAPPVNDRYPTNVWEAGDIIGDRHTVLLPAEIEPGTYDILVGLYDPVSGERLPLTAGGDHTLLQDVVVRD